MKITFNPGDFEARHVAPAWREQSNFIISNYLGVHDGGNGWEQIWAKQMADNEFVVCCIPFFAYNLNLGDKVSTDENYTITGVTEKSGMETFRVWLKSGEPEAISTLISFMEKNGALYEYYSGSLIALSCRGDVSQKIADYLQGAEDDMTLTYEAGGIDRSAI